MYTGVVFSPQRGWDSNTCYSSTDLKVIMLREMRLTALERAGRVPHSLWLLLLRPAQGPATKAHWLSAHRATGLFSFTIITLSCIPKKH